MKTFLPIGFVVLLSVATASAQGSEQIIKQRAKDLRDQNSARQGVPPPGQPPPPKPAPPTQQPPVPPPPLTPQQQSIAKIKTDFAKFKPGSEITTEQKEQLGKDLSAAALGATKPSAASVTKLANDLAAALSGKTIAAADQTKLASDIAALLSGASLPASQTQALATDAQMVLQVSGVKREVALGVVADLKAISAELQKAPAKQ